MESRITLKVPKGGNLAKTVVILEREIEWNKYDYIKKMIQNVIAEIKQIKKIDDMGLLICADKDKVKILSPSRLIESELYICDSRLHLDSNELSQWTKETENGKLIAIIVCPHCEPVVEKFRQISS